MNVIQVACLVLAQLGQPTIVEGLSADSRLSDQPSLPSSAAPASGAIDDAPRFSPAAPFVDPRSAGPRPRFGVSDDTLQTGSARQASAEVAIKTSQSAMIAADLAQVCTIAVSQLPEDARTGARAVTLLEVLSGHRRGHSEVVLRYWDLAIATGAFRFALQEQQFLENQLGRFPRGSVDQTLLQAELAAAHANRKRARLNVLTEQEKLKMVSRELAVDASPWPADTPLVGPYRTRFAEIFARSPKPTTLQQIDRALPLLQEQIELQSTAVAAAESALEAIESTARGQNVDRLLDAHRRLQARRREFLAVVKDYNQRIAEYALAITGPGAAPETLVSTLIRARGELIPVQQRSVRSAAADFRSR